MRNSIVVDATGVGAPVIDMMRRARLGVPISAVVITGGDAVTLDGSKVRVPKRDLVSNLAVMLQEHHLRIAAGLSLAEVLVQELLNFKAKISSSGHDSYEAWREGQHDDLVLAVALACWMGKTQGTRKIRFSQQLLT